MLSYVFVIAALLWWKRPAAADSALSENFLGAFRAGLRYTRASRELHVVLLRAAVFFVFASSVWALLPLVARQMLAGGADFYGVLLGAVGAGAIGGALVMPRLRARLDADAMLLLAALLTAAVMGSLVLAPPQVAGRGAAAVARGCGWIVALTTLNGVAQSILPNWVRGRGAGGVSHRVQRCDGGGQPGLGPGGAGHRRTRHARGRRAGAGGGRACCSIA